MAGAFAGADHHFVFPRLVSEVTVPVGAPEFGEEQALAVEESTQVDADLQDVDVIFWQKNQSAARYRCISIEREPID
ncbi:MAG: hypothetical protein P8X95_28540 [Anaerolineales bacterium]